MGTPGRRVGSMPPQWDSKTSRRQPSHIQKASSNLGKTSAVLAPISPSAGMQSRVSAGEVSTLGPNGTASNAVRYVSESGVQVEHFRRDCLDLLVRWPRLYEESQANL